MSNLAILNNLKELPLSSFLASDPSEVSLAKKLAIAYQLGAGATQKAIAFEYQVSVSYVSKVNVLIKGAV